VGNRTFAAALLPLAALALCLTTTERALAQETGEPNMVIEVAGDNLGRLELQLTPTGTKEPIRYHFEAERGTVIGGIALPKEGGARYEIAAYDLEGRQTHAGRGSLGSYGQTDKGAHLPLEPLEGGEGLDVAVMRDRLVLEVLDGGSPERMSVRAHVLDPRGNAARIEPGDLTWQLTDGRLIHLIPHWDAPGVDVVPNKNSGILELCPLEPKVVACKIGSSCKAIRVCNDPFVRVSTGSDHTCALTRDGVAFCWGLNTSGQLGAPTTTSCGHHSMLCSTRPIPVACPAGSPCRFTQIASGVTLTVALDVNGDVWWWGRGTISHHRVSAVLAGTPQKFSHVAAGFGHGCAISQSRSEAWCWGTNAYGEAGAPLPVLEVPDHAPQRVLVPAKFRRISAGGEHTCAVGQGGTDVVCWGRNDSLQTSGTSFSGFPDPVKGPFFFQKFSSLVSISDVVTSGTGSCINMNIGVRCWGANQVANGGALGWPDRIAMGETHICALTNQQASCLGVGAWGQLGIGAMLSTSTPLPVVAPPALLADLAANNMHSCGITPDGDAFCWGYNSSGQLGNGASNVVANRTPVKVLR
jgi:alpha-tubulin suppressor-like RCC1 family protein